MGLSGLENFTSETFFLNEGNPNNTNIDKFVTVKNKTIISVTNIPDVLVIDLVRASLEKNLIFSEKTGIIVKIHENAKELKKSNKKNGAYSKGFFSF